MAIEYRWAENQIGRLPALAAELVRRRVAVMATNAPLMAKAATTTIPIIFIVGEDPVRLGLVVSLARPGGNLTGINFFSAELTAKRLELLRELVPAATRVAVLVNPTGPDAAATLRDVEPKRCSIAVEGEGALDGRHADGYLVGTTEHPRGHRCPILELGIWPRGHLW